MIRLDGPAATTAIENIEQKVRDGEWVMLLGDIDITPEERDRAFWAIERDMAEFGSRAFHALLFSSSSA